MRKILILLLLTLGINLSAQNVSQGGASYGNNNTVHQSTYFVVVEKLYYGDFTYTNSHSGFQDFMEDLKVTEPEKYKRILPLFNQLDRQVKKARNISLITGGVGIGLVVWGGVKSLNAEDFDFEESEKAMGLMLGGGIITVISGISYGFISPDADDYNRFINQFNRIYPETKLELR